MPTNADMQDPQIYTDEITNQQLVATVLRLPAIKSNITHSLLLLLLVLQIITTFTDYQSIFFFYLSLEVILLF